MKRIQRSLQMATQRRIAERTANNTCGRIHRKVYVEDTDLAIFRAIGKRLEGGT